MVFDFRALNSNGFLDKTGAAASWLCAVHCLVMPLIVSFLPLLGTSFLAGEGGEYVFIGFSVVIAALSLLPGYFKQHGKIRILILFASGIGFVIFADVLFEESIIGKTAFSLVGAICISFSHFLNRRLCLDCRKCAETCSHSSA